MCRGGLPVALHAHLTLRNWSSSNFNIYLHRPTHLHTERLISRIPQNPGRTGFRPDCMSIRLVLVEPRTVISIQPGISGWIKRTHELDSKPNECVCSRCSQASRAEARARVSRDWQVNYASFECQGIDGRRPFAVDQGIRGNRICR